MEHAARRAVLGGVLAGGLVSAGAAPASAAGFSTRLVPARHLEAGDLIVGPDSTVVRIVAPTVLLTGRYRIRYTDPHTGEPTPMTPAIDAEGYPPHRTFVVLLRNVPVSAVTLTPVPSPTDPDVIDGGSP